MRMRRRPSLVTVVVISTVVLSGCGGDEEAEPAPEAPRAVRPATAGIGSVPAGTPPVQIGAVDPATATHPEVVQIVMTADDGAAWFCTGALVSSTVAVTAGHCLQTKFTSWTVIAPTLKGRPRAKAAAAMYDARWADIAWPDLGAVRLETPIELPQYAELTDVTARVDRREPLEVSTIVRTKELPEAPFMKTGNMALTSTVDRGYTHGYGVPFYSHGGDSGAGMFLVENGTMTHKLVAVEREPDPAENLDHLSRVDAAFIAWVAAGGPGATPLPAPGGGTTTTTPTTPTTTTTTTEEPPGRKKK
jgi:hypothetical protein